MIVKISENIEKSYMSDVLFTKVETKKNIARRNAGYIARMANESENSLIAESLNKKSERIINCMKYWKWDKYISNRVMDLQKVNRCMDIFCPNCRSVSLSKAIQKFRVYFGKMIDYDFKPYFMTLTIPNINFNDLGDSIVKINKAFVKLWRWLSCNENRHGFTGRMFDIKGAIKMIEFTTSDDTGYCNLHIHSIVFINNYYPGDFEKIEEGYFRKKSNEVVLLSKADIFISKLWTMAFDDMKIKEFKNISDLWQDNYICDIRELELPGGLYEAFKYCFKDNDINNYEIFKKVFYGIQGKRLRQTYGMLYDFDKNSIIDLGIEKEVIGIKEFLDIDINEDPKRIYVLSVMAMVNKYRDYRKISRFKAFREYVNIKD